MAAKISLHGSPVASDPVAQPVLVVGLLPHLQSLRYESVACKLQSSVSQQVWQACVSSLQAGESCPLVLRSLVAALPARCSRHAAPARPLALTRLTKQHARPGSHSVLLVVPRPQLLASVLAVARAYPLYNKRTDAQEQGQLSIEIILVQETAEEGADGNGSIADDSLTVSKDELVTLRHAVDAVRDTAFIVDSPTNHMDVDIFLQQVIAVGKELKLEPTIIRGEELKEQGFGGIYGVGKASRVGPALAVLSWKPAKAQHNIAWVGKGIVYDTGGLSIKSKTDMPGMKRDCGGAAAILYAFRLAVQSGFTQQLHAVMCLAENSVGPDSTRPDDVHTLHSGRTVEINNTDAEGRLVLADGVSYARSVLGASLILDMATLTGAQGVALGRQHAALLSSCARWEQAAVGAGRSAGDLCFPVPYCPELHFSEFASAIADMKNSVADRNNAQVSCAGLFIGAQLGWDFPGVWMHVDMAAPSYSGERATGYGVALLGVLFGQFTRSSLLKSLCPSGCPEPPLITADAPTQHKKAKLH